MDALIEKFPFTGNPEALNLGPYMCVADSQLRLISIFDDLKYDRADIDMISPAMRNYAVTKLGQFGFKQTSGNVLQHEGTSIRCLIPKFHALGASPFDITRYTKRGNHDFFILTPTQTACQYIDFYALSEGSGSD